MFFLIRQVQDLRMQFATKTDTDDQIMVAVNAKVEEWKVCALKCHLSACCEICR